MIRLGLTGSIAMGKSTTAALFAEAGAAVYDADAAVHALYAPGGAAVAALAVDFPEAVTEAGVDRTILSDRVKADPSALRRLEALVHPLLAAHRAERLADAEASGADVIVLDIPLLFETGGEGAVDAVVVVTAALQVQRARALARFGMDETTFALLSARQTPDAEKRARADFLVMTDRGLDVARAEVKAILSAVLDPAWRPPRRPATSSP